LGRTWQDGLPESRPSSRAYTAITGSIVGELFSEVDPGRHQKMPQTKEEK